MAALLLMDRRVILRPRLSRYVWSLCFSGFAVALVISSWMSAEAGDWETFFMEVVAATVSTMLAIRAFRIAVIVNPSTIWLRGLLRSRRVPVGRIQSIQRVSYSGLLNWYGESGILRMLRIYTGSDSYVDFPEFAGGDRWLEATACTLNDKVRLFRKS